MWPVKEWSHDTDRLAPMRMIPIARLVPPFFLLTICCSAGWADESDPLNLLAGVSVLKDDNLFRLSPGTNTQAVTGSNQRSDTITTEYVGGSYDKTYGRQRIRLEATVNAVHFERFSQLDNNGGNLQGTLSWTLSDRLTGTAGKSRTRALTSYRDLRTPVRNIQTNDADFATGDLRLNPSLHLEGSVRHSETDNSATVNAASNSSAEIYSLGLRFTPSSGNYIALRNTWTSGHYPNRQIFAGSTIDNGYTQTDSGLEAAWQVNGVSRLSGAIAWTERSHRNVPQRNFSGWTGNLGWDWVPTGKVAVNSRLRREVGAQDDLLASYVVVEAFSLAGNWYPTAKTSLKANYEYMKRDYLGDPIAVLAFLPKRHETIDQRSISASYAPMRNLLFSVALANEKRFSNYAGYPYEDTNISATAQFGF